MSRVDEVSPSKISRPGHWAALAIASLSLAASSPVQAQGWPSYAHDQQHSSLAVAASQVPQTIRWSTAVDLKPQYTGGVLYIHYGSPVITRVNTVLQPIKTSTTGDYLVQAISGATGQVIWTSPVSDYILPGHDWVPIFGITLTPKDHYVVYPGAGGTVYARTFPDSTQGVTTQFAFFNTPTMNYYAMNPSAFNNAIQICTPISSDAVGNLFFGYVSTGAALPGYPNGIPSGLAKISSTGAGSFVSAATLTGDSTMKIAYNCSPSFSTDGTLVYVAANVASGNGGKGYLCAASTTTLVPQASKVLLDPRSTPTNTLYAFVDDDGSATPSVGPDHDVYYGVLAYNISDNHYRGFLLHFDKMLTTSKLPSAFGWDDTASIVPIAAVPGYSGPSTYLLLTKYNNYAGGAGGNGVNQLALVDPNASFVDPISGITAMNPYMTVDGVTPDPDFNPCQYPNAVREWCINSAAIDTINQCAVVNSEDGHVYRWSFATNTLSSGLDLGPATSEAYTPTVIGPDGAIYAINDAKLFCCIATIQNAISKPTLPPAPISAPIPK